MSTTSPIAPTIGRVVLVRHDAYDGDVPAIINAVHSNDCISVCIMPFGIAPMPLTSILYSEDHAAGGFHASWHWMDYQIKVAAERDPVSGEPVEGEPSPTS